MDKKYLDQYNVGEALISAPFGKLIADTIRNVGPKGRDDEEETKETRETKEAYLQSLRSCWFVRIRQESSFACNWHGKML